MSRNRHPQEFGSDSFLDVLANIVGILIILIVVASTRPGNVPVLSVPNPGPLALPEPVVVEKTVKADLGPDEPPPEVSEELIRLAAELQAVQAQTGDLEAKLTETQSAGQSKAAELAARKKALDDARERIRAFREKGLTLKGAVEQARNDLKGALAEFEEAGKAKPNVAVLEHKVTPISQLIEGPEVHFRLIDNQVQVIPLQELIERVKSQIEGKKEYLARHRRQEGSVGPVEGFSLRYVVESQSLTPLEELRHGQGMFRITLGMWELVAEPDLEGETAVQALKRGSNFTRAIESADADASLTFWVYPDSFSLFRKLQSEAHKAGFVVTGRPLPDGAPIAGSPSGTRSAGQ